MESSQKGAAEMSGVDVSHVFNSKDFGKVSFCV